jgi:hypothetical protein
MAFWQHSGTMNAQTAMHPNSFMSAAAILFLLVAGNVFATDAALTTDVRWTDLRPLGVEGSTDGSHPNDLGFTRQAKIFAAVLKPLLKP